MSVTFDCLDCLRSISSFGFDRVPDPPLCAGCQLLRAMPDGPDKDHIRKVLDCLPPDPNRLALDLAHVHRETRP
jgi:hypothetical protein